MYVATPKTDVRFTGVKDGAYEGFMQFAASSIMFDTSSAPNSLTAHNNDRCKKWKEHFI